MRNKRNITCRDCCVLKIFLLFSKKKQKLYLDIPREQKLLNITRLEDARKCPTSSTWTNNKAVPPGRWRGDDNWRIQMILWWPSHSRVSSREQSFFIGSAFLQRTSTWKRIFTPPPYGTRITLVIKRHERKG